MRVTNLSDLAIDDDFGGGGNQNTKPLEPALERFLADLEWSDHLVLTTPMWWGGLPARLKGLIDGAFLLGRAFDTKNTKLGGMPSPLLTGRSARVILTSDAPGWIMQRLHRRALIRQLRGQILGFVGFKPTRFTYLSGASHPKPKQVRKWASRIERTGAAAA